MLRLIMCLLKQNPLTADHRSRYAVPGINGEMLNDEPSLFAQLYGGRVSIGKTVYIIQCIVAPALVVDVPSDEPLTFLCNPSTL